MKKLSLFIAITAVTMHMFAQKNVGIGNSSPVTKLDISGALSLREGAALSLSNGGSRGGANDNITLPEITGTTDIASFYRITGPTALFSIFGITPNTGADGQVVTLVNTTAYTLTIINNNSSGTGSSIITQTGANILDNAGSSITLQYNKSAGAWYVTATQNYAVTNIQGNPVSNAAPSTNNVLQWNGSSWVPAAASGVTGATGATGSNGAAGPVGATGVDGPTGASGATGNTGPGYLATSASSLTIGSGSQTFTTQSGLAYLPNDEIRISHSATNYMEGTVNFYSATTMIANITNAVGSGTFSSWNIGIAGISGVSGVPGISGVAGVSGVPGATGADGASGVPGAQGVSGIPGVQGISGVSGTPGATGAQGPSGVSGIQGIQGPTGASGISGATGAQGPSGVSGIQGIQGPTGASGISGATGAQGPSGVSGVQGIQGPTGASGISGVTGAQGPSGVSGIQGIQGPTGASGISGATGATGPSGPSGASGVAGTTITVTASNGLTSSGGSSPNITLGGNLTQNTTVTLATGGTNYNMIFNTNSTTNSTGVANYTGGNMVLGTGDGGTPFGGVLRGPNAGNSNTTGGNLVLDAGWATGTAAGGSVFVNGGTTGTGSNGNVYLRGGYSNSLEGAVYLNDDHNGSTFLNDNGGTVTVGSGIAGAQTVTINNASGLYSNTESQSSGLAILTGTNSSGTQGTSDYILYMGADKTNDLGYIQAVKYGLATTQLALNARGGNVGIGTATPQAPLEVSNVGTDVMKVTSTAGGVGNHAYIDFETFAGNYLNARIGAVDMGSNNGSLVFETGNQGTTSTTTTERMRVLNTGAVAFNGATNYGTAGNQLFSNGNAAPTWAALNLAGGSNYVSGILPVANGGTGSSSQAWVDLTTAQTAGGVKTWSSNANFGGLITMNGTSQNTNQGVEWNYGTNDRYGMVQSSGGGMTLYTSTNFASSFVSFALSGTTGGSLGTELMRLTHTGAMAFNGATNYGTTGNQLFSNGNAAPTWSALNLAGGANYVTGILPVANGGTGSSTQGWVDLTTNQTAAGNKTWTGTSVFGAGATARAALGLTTSANNATTYSANSDVTDPGRQLSIVNENATTNSMAILSMRSNPGGGANNQMMDMKLVNPNNGGSNLIYTFASGGTFNDRFTMTSAGNFGIGTTAPQTQLANTATNTLGTDGAGTSANSINWANNAAGYTQTLYNAGSGTNANGLAVKVNSTNAATRILDLSTGSSQASSGTTVMAVMGNGNVGIGTSTPSVKTEIDNAAADLLRLVSTTGGAGNHAYIDFATYNSTGISARVGAIDMGGCNGGLVFETSNAGSCTNTTTIEAMRLLNTGAVAFNGATNYGTAGNQLFSNGNAAPTWTALNLAGGANYVSGILPVANGGTGSSTQGWVDLTTTQSVAGVKTWTSNAGFGGCTSPQGAIGFNNSGTNGIAWGSGPFTYIYDNGNIHYWTDDQTNFESQSTGTGARWNWTVGQNTAGNAGGAATWMALYNGNLGIGQTTPTQRLHVYTTTNGDGILIDGNTSVGLGLGTGGTQKAAFGLAESAGSWSTDAAIGDAILRSASSQKLIFNTNAGTGASTMYLNGSNVNMPNLAVSSAVYTDASHNLTTVAPTGGTNWFTTGNTGTAPTSYADGSAQTNNFMGTTDNQPVFIYTNSSSSNNKSNVELYTSTSTTNAAAASTDIFHVRRNGQTGVSYPQVASFALGKYAAGINSQTQLDLRLGNGGVYVPDITVMSLLANGSVGIGTTSPGNNLLNVSTSSAQATANTQGAGITMTGQTGNGSGSGGAISLTAGNGGTGGGGGSVTITGGTNGISTFGGGGNVTIAGGNANTSSGYGVGGGVLSLSGGNCYNAGGSGGPGNVNITAGGNYLGANTLGNINFYTYYNNSNASATSLAMQVNGSTNGVSISNSLTLNSLTSANSGTTMPIGVNSSGTVVDGSRHTYSTGIVNGGWNGNTGVQIGSFTATGRPYLVIVNASQYVTSTGVHNPVLSMGGGSGGTQITSIAPLYYNQTSVHTEHTTSLIYTFPAGTVSLWIWTGDSSDSNDRATVTVVEL